MQRESNAAGRPSISSNVLPPSYYEAVGQTSGSSSSCDGRVIQWTDPGGHDLYCMCHECQVSTRLLNNTCDKTSFRDSSDGRAAATLPEILKRCRRCCCISSCSIFRGRRGVGERKRKRENVVRTFCASSACESFCSRVNR